MTAADRSERTERHALVTAIWLPAGVVAAASLHYGFGAGGPLWVMTGFGAILLGFVGHVIVNAVLSTEFSRREVALGLVLYGFAGLALGLCSISVDGFASHDFLPAAAGLAALAAAAVFYMVARYGVRRAFENFDVVREFNPRESSRLPRRRSRR
jgi:hypothetical protein